jgi:hypothetical protein
MKNHTVTTSQEKRIGIPAGTVIQVEMYTEDEIKARIEKVPEIRNIAKNYYLNGQRRGGILHLPD